MNQTVILTVKTADIIEGTRRREQYGDIPALARSIEKHSLLQPIGVSNDMRLVFGGRRLRAINLLGWEKVAVKLLGNLTDEQIGEMELAENGHRLDLTPYEQAKTFLAEVKETARLISGKLPEKDSRGRKSVYGVPKEDLADAHGTSERELARTEKFAETADAFPAFQQPQWKPYHVLEAKTHLDKLSEAERAEAVALIDQPAIAPKAALTILANLAQMPEPERAEVFTLQHSDDPRDRDAAITRPAREQPMPDARLKIIGDAIRELKRARDLIKDDFRQDIAQLVNDVASVREALKSADTERMEGERGKLHSTAA